MKKIAALALGLTLAATSAVYAQQNEINSPQEEQKAQATIQRYGYRDIQNLRFDDGQWIADAFNRKGEKVEVRLNLFDGQIKEYK